MSDRSRRRESNSSDRGHQVQQQHQPIVAGRAAANKPVPVLSVVGSSFPGVVVATGAASPSSAVVASGSSRRDMYDQFQVWALKTYGDSAKTKTVTRKKYNRIVKILRGEEQNSAENSKFRFWVKAKGFRVGPPPDKELPLVTNATSRRAAASVVDQVLYVPCAHFKPADGKDDAVFKKVAVVENFFDIIYNVHVEMDGRGGKHAGQKRTYRAIAETYAFLPREAVTKFLMQCADCQKRMHVGADTSNGVSSPADSSRTVDSADSAGSLSDPPEIDFSLPITTTYLKHLRNLGYSEEDVLNMEHEETVSNEESFSSRDPSPQPLDEEMSPYSGKEDDDKTGILSSASPKYSSASSPSATSHVAAADPSFDCPLDMSKGESAGCGAGGSSGGIDGPTNGPSSSPSSSSSWTNNQPLNMSRTSDVGRRTATRPAHSLSTGLPPPPGGSGAPSSSSHRPHAHRRRHPSSTSHRHHHHNNHAASQSALTAAAAVAAAAAAAEVRDLPEHTYEDIANGSYLDRTGTPEDLSGTVKDEDDEEDDEADEKMDIHKYDPERLKAFNMFVRLFVDENLDRMVPISKQPKEKIQAIIDSCSRQFPEFSERSRKRIRTYLKSCRRTKRFRDQNGWDPGRPTPPHLTSAMAEQILASACDNESNNAKRMRLGLEPVSVCSISDRDTSERLLEPAIRQPASLRAYANDMHHNGSAVATTTNGSMSSYRGTNTPSSATSNSGSTANQFTGLQGPADLSIKRQPLAAHSGSAPQPPPSSQPPPPPPVKCTLNPNEVSAVRQLIASYRESAAFLIRSADELEQLLLQQN